MEGGSQAYVCNGGSHNESEIRLENYEMEDVHSSQNMFQQEVRAQQRTNEEINFLQNTTERFQKKMLKSFADIAETCNGLRADMIIVKDVLYNADNGKGARLYGTETILTMRLPGFGTF